MRCIYCLREFTSLTDEHVIPLALGGPLVLKSAACRACNSQVAGPLDHYLADVFPPTRMARAELALRGRKNRDPVMPVVGLDPELGRVEMLLQKGISGSDFVLRHGLRKQGDYWFVQARDILDALRIISQQLNREITMHEVERWGIVDARTFELEERVDWERARRAATKIFYAYCLLECGESILPTAPMESLREFILTGHAAQALKVEGGAGIEPSERFGIPPHHHLLLCDAEHANNNGVWLFRVFWFMVALDLIQLGSGGAFIGIDPVKRMIVEAAGRSGGSWHPREPIRWRWLRG